MARPIPRWDLSPQPRQEDWHRLETQAREYAVPRARERMDGMTVLGIQPGPPPTLRIMLDPRGTPQASTKRNPDDTLTYTQDGKPLPDALLLPPGGIGQAPLREIIAQELLGELLNQPDTRNIILRAAALDWALAELADVMRQAAREMLEDTTCQVVTTSGPRRIPLKRAPRTQADLVRRHLVDADVLRIIRETSPLRSGDITLRHYNLAVTNRRDPEGIDWTPHLPQDYLGPASRHHLTPRWSMSESGEIQKIPQSQPDDLMTRMSAIERRTAGFMRRLHKPPPPPPDPTGARPLAPGTGRRRTHFNTASPEAGRKRLVEHLIGPAADRVSRELGPITPLQVTTERDSASLDILVRQGRAVWSIRRNPGGALSSRGQRHLSDTTVHPSLRETTQPLRHHVAVLLVTDAWKYGDRAALLSLALDRDDLLPEDLYRRSMDVMDQALRPPETAAAQGNPPARLDQNRLVEEATRQIQDHFLDRQTTDTALQLFTQYGEPRNQDMLTPRQYNVTAQNLRLLRKLLQTAPNVVHHYCLYMVDQNTPRTRLRHPGQLVQEVRKDVSLSPRQWRTFCRIPPEWRDPGAIRPTCEAIARANQPRADARRLHLAAGREQYHQEFEAVDWERGEPFAAWVQVLNRFLDPANSPQAAQLDRVADALRGHIQEDLPWGPCDWGNLVQRADRWHLQLNLQRHLTQQAADAAWETQLPQGVTHSGVTFTPVTTGPDLVRLGLAMNNCLPSYVRRCELGHSRIFAVTTGNAPPADPTQAIAAVELYQAGGHWQIGQLEAPHLERVPQQVRRAAPMLLRDYQEAHESTSAASQDAGNIAGLPG